MKKYIVETLINKLPSEEGMDTLQEARDYITKAFNTWPDYCMDGGFQIIETKNWTPVEIYEA